MWGGWAGNRNARQIFPISPQFTVVLQPVGEEMGSASCTGENCCCFFPMVLFSLVCLTQFF